MPETPRQETATVIMPAPETSTPVKHKEHREHKDCLWGDIDYDDEPWVSNATKPFEITHGLQGRHLAVWASHGRYYDIGKAVWKWQRPFLFGTTEDLFTQTIVVPYLIPMLEHAGAVVFTPRERDWQRNEVVVDNDDKGTPSAYTERNGASPWRNADIAGFGNRDSCWHDHENPFEMGTTRMAKAAKNTLSEITYQPQIPKKGCYAVYVSYPTLDNSVPDARYTVYHQGQSTTFLVNQRMGGGTWVYLGTFCFDEGSHSENRVVLSNYSNHKGVVTADAVRFGGGMGSIERGGTTSGMPRCLEGARYYAQWAGAPYHVYSSKSGQDDYSDDINVRSFMTNWIAGGSCYVPEKEGKRVPIELSLAVHSDAGYATDYRSLVGSLGICTTNYNEGKLGAGISREASRTLAKTILDGAQSDLSQTFLPWVVRELRNANYSETRCPEVPSTIFETLSHQSFPDMVLAQDPNFRFVLARSIYKSILRFVSESHGQSCVVAPLAPTAPRVEFTSADGITLSWEAQKDSLEKSAQPTSYIVYTAIGDGDFDNGKPVKSRSFSTTLQPGVLYSFRITAVNKGGESFPSEVVSALRHQGATRSIMIVNGFHRIAAPAIHENDTEQGFDYDADPGVIDGRTAGMSGRQICFDKSQIGIEGPGGLGYSGQEWQGKVLVGNTFDYIRTHADAMMSLEQYNIGSCSAQAVESGKVDIMKYHIVDWILGMQKQDNSLVKNYKTFTPRVQQQLRKFTQSGGALLVSGAYVGSDNHAAADSLFLRDVLKARHDGIIRGEVDTQINGMGTTMHIYRALNEEHYAATSTDILQPVPPAFCALTFSGMQPACVAYQGDDYHAFTIGFPFECITDRSHRRAVMRGIVNFLIDK